MSSGSRQESAPQENIALLDANLYVKIITATLSNRYFGLHIFAKKLQGSNTCLTVHKFVRQTLQFVACHQQTRMVTRVCFVSNPQIGSKTICTGSEKKIMVKSDDHMLKDETSDRARIAYAALSEMLT